jgi:predicted dithiol-disulfide oxidoreductase (DUF899 family)
MHLTGTREEWLAARLKLLKEEKELTRPSDELGWRRQELAGLFQGRPQFPVCCVFGSDDKAGCPFCPSIADGFNGIVVSLANHDVMPWAVSRADFNVSFAELQPFALFASMGGTDAPTYALDRPGASAFALEDGVVCHAYSTYVRGLDRLWAMYQWLDRAPKRRSQTAAWLRRHDVVQGLR